MESIAIEMECYVDEQIHISLLEKERLIGIESQQRGFAETQKFHGGNLVLEASKETKRSE